MMWLSIKNHFSPHHSIANDRNSTFTRTSFNLDVDFLRSSPTTRRKFGQKRCCSTAFVKYANTSKATCFDHTAHTPFR
jgi:hypothetical protein